MWMMADVTDDMYTAEGCKQQTALAIMLFVVQVMLPATIHHRRRRRRRLYYHRVEPHQQDVKCCVTNNYNNAIHNSDRAARVKGSPGTLRDVCSVADTVQPVCFLHVVRVSMSISLARPGQQRSEVRTFDHIRHIDS